MSRELVSVCIPVLNAGQYLEPTIESVLAQTYTPIEVIVSDAGSTDGAFERVRNLYGDRIRAIGPGAGSGQGIRNDWLRALSFATGTWVKLLPQDDLLRPQCIEHEMQGLAAATEECAGVFGGRDIVDSQGRHVLNMSVPPPGVWDGGTLLRHSLRRGTNLLGPPGCVTFRRDLIPRLDRVTGAWPFVIDLECYLALFADGQRVLSLGERTTSYRAHEGALTTRLGWRQVRDYWGLLGEASCGGGRSGSGTVDRLAGTACAAGYAIARWGVSSWLRSRITRSSHRS